MNTGHNGVVNRRLYVLLAKLLINIACWTRGRSFMLPPHGKRVRAHLKRFTNGGYSLPGRINQYKPTRRFAPCRLDLVYCRPCRASAVSHARRAVARHALMQSGRTPDSRVLIYRCTVSRLERGPRRPCSWKISVIGMLLFAWPRGLRRHDIDLAMTPRYYNIKSTLLT